MKILHIYPNGDTQLSRYVGLLQKSMADAADLESEAITDDARELKSVLQRGTQFDIIHLHGAVRCTLPQEPRLVVSAHGADIVKRSREPFAVIARSEMERSRLQEQQCRRIELVRNPVLTRTITWDVAARKMNAIYQKVIDSDVIELMDANTLQALTILLKAGICGDKRWVEGREIPEADWRKMCIYAEYEGVGAMLHKGIVTMGISVPAIDATHIPTYLPEGYQKPAPMEGKPIPYMVAKAKDNLSLSLLVDMHRALMSTELDEEMLMQELDREKLIEEFTCMLQLLNEHTLLDEGFMPCKPADNRRTKQLNQILYKHLHI